MAESDVTLGSLIQEQTRNAIGADDRHRTLVLLDAQKLFRMLRFIPVRTALACIHCRIET